MNRGAVLMGRASKKILTLPSRSARRPLGLPDSSNVSSTRSMKSRGWPIRWCLIQNGTVPGARPAVRCQCSLTRRFVPLLVSRGRRSDARRMLLNMGMTGSRPCGSAPESWTCPGVHAEAGGACDCGACSGIVDPFPDRPERAEFGQCAAVTIEAIPPRDGPGVRDCPYGRGATGCSAA